MKIGMVNKLTIMNRFVLHILQRNITHIAVITRKTNINIDILKGGGKVEKSRRNDHIFLVKGGSRVFSRGVVFLNTENFVEFS